MSTQLLMCGPLRPQRTLWQAIAALLTSTCLGTAAAFAQNATWIGGNPGDPTEWTEPNNWTTLTVPSGTATFTSTGSTSVDNDNGIVSIGAINFTGTPNAQAYTISIYNPFIVNGAGVANNSTNTQTFNVTTSGATSNTGTLVFQNASSANSGSGPVSYNIDPSLFIFFENTSTAGGNTTFTNNGFIEFQDNSSAGSATITNNLGGQIDFFSSATALNANITNASGATLTFNNNATAANATIGNSGIVDFNNSSTAGSASITTLSGGSVVFGGNSSGGGAQFITNGIGSVDFSGTTGPASNNQVSAGSIAGSGNYFLGADTLTVGSNNLSSSVSGVISDGGASGGTGASLIKVGTGTLTLSGTNAYTGGTTISAGTLALSGTGSIATSSGVTDNATFDISGTSAGASITTLSGSGAVALGGETLTLSNASGTFSGVITNGGISGGTGGVLVQSSGTETLTGANTYSGGTTLNGGTLVIGNNSALGTGTLAMAAGTTLSFLSTGNFAIANAITITGDPFFTPPSGTTQTLSGVIANGGSAGTLNMTGAGTLVLSGINTYTGGTAISSGVLQVTNGSSVGTGIVTLDGGTFQSGAAGLAFGNAFAINTTGGTVDTQANTLTLSGAIGNGNGPGTLTKIGTGTLILTGTNTYSGGTVISAGDVQATNNNSVGSGTVTLNGGTFQAGAAGLAFANTFAINTTGGTVDTQANTLTLSGAIGNGNGPGTLTKIGTGTLILTGTNTYSGGTGISAGDLQVTNNNSVGSGTVTLNGGTFQAGAAGLAFANTFAINTTGGTVDTQANTLTLSGAIGNGNGAGALTKIGSGTLILTGTGTYSGGTTISAGTLRIGNGGTAGSITGNVTNNASLVFDLSSTATVGGAILGSGAVTQAGSGTLILSGASSYSGATTVSAGTLDVTGSLGNTAVTVQNGATLAGTGSIAGAVTIGSGGTLMPGNGSPGTITVGPLTLNSGSLLSYQLGTPNVAGGSTNDLTMVNGALTINGGTLNVTNSGSFGPGVYQIIDYSGTLGGSGTIAVGTLPNGDTGVIQTAIPGEVNLVVSNGTALTQFWDGATTTGDGTIHGGSGTWNTSTTNWTTPNGTINASWQGGTAVFAGAAGTVTVGAPISYQGLQFMTTGYVVTATGGNALMPTGVAPINVGSGLTATISAPIEGAGGVQVTGLGTLVLSGTNTYTGGTVISSGILQVTNNSSVGTGTVTLDGATFQSGANGLSFSNAMAINATGGTIDTNGNTLAWTGVIGNGSGTGALTAASTVAGGVLTLTNANTYSGATTINAGATLALTGTGSIVPSSGVANNGTFSIAGLTNGGASITSLSGSGTVTLGANTLTLSNAGSTFSGAIGGSGGLTLTAGTETLSGSNGYTGATTINGGTLALSGTGSIASSSGVADNGTFSIAGLTNGGASITSLSGGGTVTLGANTLTLSNAGSTFSGAIGGSGGLTLTAGTETLTGTNGYSGLTTIGAGTLQLGNGGTAGSISGNVIDNGVLVFNRSDTVTFGGAISGSGALQQNGGVASNVILTATNTYSGGTTIAAGTLQIGNGGTTGSIAGNVADNGNLAFDRSDTVTFSGTLSGSGTLTQMGPGTLTLLNANTYSGGTFLLSGTLAVGNNNALGSGPLGMVDGTTLQFTQSGINLPNAISLGVLAGTVDTGANTDTLSGVISGPNDLTKIGTGTLILSATNTYSGPTNVNVGTLEVNGSIANSSLTTVASGTALTGTGTVGNLQINSGGMFAPGSGTPGSALTVTGNLAFQSGAIYLVQVSLASATSARVAGTASLAGTVAASFAPGSYMMKQYDIFHSAGFGGTTFAALQTTNLPANFTASLSYTTTDTLLNLIAVMGQPTGLSTLGLNVNQQNVATSLNNFFNAGGVLTPGFVSVFGLTGVPLANALSQLDGEAAADGEFGAFRQMDQFLGLMLDPFVDGRSGTGWPGGGGVQAIGFAPQQQASFPSDIALGYAGVLKAPPKPVDFDQRWSAWGASFGGGSTTNGNAAIGSNTVSADDYGFAGGVDYHFSRDSVGGFALAGGGTNWDLAGGLGGGRSDSFQAGAYGATRSGPFYLAGALAFANHWMTTNRIAFAGDQLDARFNAQSFAGRLEAGYRYAPIPLIGITPYAALQAQNFHTPGYSETDLTGGGFGLNYNAMTASDTRSELGARFDDMMVWNGMPLSLRSRLAWAHDWITNPFAVAVFQALPGASFIVNGATPPKDSALASAGAELHMTSHWSLAAKFDGEFANTSRTYAGTGTLRYSW